MKISIELDDTGRSTPSVKVFRDGVQVGFLQSLFLKVEGSAIIPQMKISVVQCCPDQEFQKILKLGDMVGVTVGKDG